MTQHDAVVVGAGPTGLACGIELQQRGLNVILDLVPNHTSTQHPWFLESRSSRENPKRDWYVWQDAKPDGSLPNNWQSSFIGPAWHLDEVGY